MLNLLAQAAANPPMRITMVPRSLILLFGCGGAIVLFIVVAIVVVLVAANQRRDER